MVDLGLTQVIVYRLNRWYRRRAKPHGAVDHFNRGTRMGYRAASRLVPCLCSLMLLIAAGLLYFVPNTLTEMPSLEVLALKFGWVGVVVVAFLTPFEVFREYVVITDDGLLKSNLFGRQTRMAWKDIVTFRLNVNDNKVVFTAGKKAKLTVSLAYDGWQDFLETAARQMDPALYAQFYLMFANLDVKRPVLKSIGKP